MAKPIFIVRVPVQASMEQIGKMQQDLDKKLGEDYHVLVARVIYPPLDGTPLETEFQVLNAKDMTELEFEELKEIVKSLNKELDV